MSTGLVISTVRVLVLVGLGIGILLVLAAQPTLRSNTSSQVTVDPERLRAHVITLSETFYPRHWQAVDNLERCADYIAAHLAEAGAAIEFQAVPAAGRTYRNVIARWNRGRGRKLVVGAHYDAYGELPGANDNASGVAALLELAHLLGRHPPDLDLELVAYVLEEPPFFRTPQMGSAVHAASLAAAGDTIAGVIVLEMLGWFSDQRGSQSYPLPFFHLFYPSRGNFIAVVGPWHQGRWIQDVKIGMKGTTGLPVYSIRAPASIPGVDFSDHRNYWPHGIPAVMITDTAFYRDRAYHTIRDTHDRLDYTRMAQVVVGVFEAIHAIAASPEP